MKIDRRQAAVKRARNSFIEFRDIAPLVLAPNGTASYIVHSNKNVHGILCRIQPTKTYRLPFLWALSRLTISVRSWKLSLYCCYILWWVANPN